jgi:hypothetical protein
MRGPGQRPKCPACAEKDAELSRARGEIDAAHVVLTGAGVHRSEGQSVQDRIARYIGETETKLEEKDAEIARLTSELRAANAPWCPHCSGRMFDGRCFGCDRLSETGR